MEIKRKWTPSFEIEVKRKTIPETVSIVLVTVTEGFTVHGKSAIPVENWFCFYISLGAVEQVRMTFELRFRNVGKV